MKISFNISDNNAANYIAAVRLIIDKPNLTDEEIIDRHLKQFIRNTINDYLKTYLAVNYKAEVDRLSKEVIISEENLCRAMSEYDSVMKQIEQIYVPVDDV
jgi:hypothetical protein